MSNQCIKVQHRPSSLVKDLHFTDWDQLWHSWPNYPVDLGVVHPLTFLTNIKSTDFHSTLNPKAIWSKNNITLQNRRAFYWSVDENLGSLFWFDSECNIHIDFDTNKYLNIFVSRKWNERISEYICIKIWTPMNIQIYLYKINLQRRHASRVHFAKKHFG